MTKIIINNRTDAWKTDVNLLNYHFGITGIYKEWEVLWGLESFKLYRILFAEWHYFSSSKFFVQFLPLHIGISAVQLGIRSYYITFFISRIHFVPLRFCLWLTRPLNNFLQRAFLSQLLS